MLQSEVICITAYWIFFTGVAPSKPRSCAQFAPECKFAPGVYFLPCERCFKNLHPVRIAPGCKFAPAFEVVQIYLHSGANLHPGANGAHERKLYNFYTFCWEISINGRHFLLRCCLKSNKNKFQVVFIE